MKKLTNELSEFDEQILLADWLNLKQIKFTASANGGSRNIIEAKKMKKMGVSPGFPDIEIPLPRGRFHGLYIELKNKKRGRISESQQEWLIYLNEKGYLALCAHGFEKAKEIIQDYMKL